VPLQIKKVGQGSKYVLLANGVGTDLFMWLPIFECAVAAYPALFADYTFIIPSYRGLFTHDTARPMEVEVTMDNCIGDTLLIMKHFGIKQYHTIIGWSTGAQLAMTCCAEHPEVTQQLFLLNPSTGRTLHTVLQPLVPLPAFMGSVVSWVVRSALKSLIPLCYTSLWPVLKRVAESSFFRLFLEGLAFFGGFPHHQPVYFHQYMFDVFSCPTHTMALLNLIVSLDAPCPPKALTLKHNIVIISGLMDFMTGIYHSMQLTRSFPRCRQVMFTMGSHFVLIEWPQLVAEELAALLKDKPTSSKTAMTR
jgi:pimeloyl-ACP methyl ester carboxylesterase